jgi:hypothetical protein
VDDGVTAVHDGVAVDADHDARERGSHGPLLLAEGVGHRAQELLMRADRFR